MEKRIINFAANFPALQEGDKGTSIETIRRCLDGAATDQLVLTSSSAESVNQVLWSVFLKISRTTGKCHFITSLLEDAPTLQMMQRLEELGCFVKLAPLDAQGRIDVAMLKKMINPKTAVISISIAQGLTGIIQPIEEIAKIAEENKVLLHLEGSQAIGKIHFSFLDSNADYLTFSGETAGAILAKNTAPLVPLIVGGNHLHRQDLAPSLLQNLARHIEQETSLLDAMSLEVALLRNFFEKEITSKIPGTQILFKTSYRLPNTSVIAFSKIHQEAFLYFLKKEKVLASFGGAFSQHLYPLLTASQIDPNTALSAMSFSFGASITREEIQEAALRIEQIVSALRLFSLQIETERTPPPSFPFPLSKKCQEKIERPRFVGIFTEEEAKAKGMRLVIGKENQIAFYWLVDESDGVIADARFQAFGGPFLFALGEIASELCLRKTTAQASRISSDLLDGHGRDKKDTAAFPKEAAFLINQVLSAIDVCVDQCRDLVFEAAYDTTPIAWEGNDNPDGIPGWEGFAKEKKLQIIEEVIAKEIRPYIELDEGGVQVLALEDNALKISYQGACTTCYSATGSTLSAIQQILRARVFPKLVVIPML